MKILVVGANGKTGTEIVERLLEKDHQVRAMVKEEGQMEKFRKLGAEPVLADLQQDISFSVIGCDGVIFTAGSGAGTSKELTFAVDRDGAEKLVDACIENGVNRFIMLSAAGAAEPDKANETIYPYMQAKHDADQKLIKSNLNYTIFRPYRLINGNEVGKVDVKRKFIDKEGAITRIDLAHAMVGSLEQEGTFRKVFEIMEGDEPINDALNNI